MFMRVPVPLALLLSVALTQTACEKPPPEISSADMERARTTLQPFKEQLMAALVEDLDQGPENAIRVCREKAPQIAASLSVDGVRIGRTSHRLRNPANAPEKWMEPLLELYQKDPSNEEPRAVRLDETNFGYVEPIRVQHFCVSCHGPSIDSELLATIGELYPEDQATGFRAGDFRGLFWVTLPASQS